MGNRKLSSNCLITLLLCLHLALIHNIAGAYIEKNGDVSGETWLAGTYLVTNDLTVSDNATLTIEAGAVIKFRPHKRISVYGTIRAKGVDGNPVVFTSRDDDIHGEIIPDSDGAPAPGDWYGVHLTGSTAQGIGEFDWCVFMYGGDLSGNLLFFRSESGHFVNSACIYSMSNGIFVQECSPIITDSVFIDNAEAAIGLSYPQYTGYTGNSFSGNGINGVYISGTIYKDTFLSGTSTFVMHSGLEVQTGVTLTVDAGVIIKAEFLREGEVSGTLDVNGTRENPVVFTSLKDDTYGGDTNGDGDVTSPAPGDWGGIYLEGYDDEQGIGEFDWCIVRYGWYQNISFNSSDSAHFIDSVSEYSSGYGLEIINCSPTVRRSRVENNQSHGIHIRDGGKPDLGASNFADGGRNVFINNSFILGYQVWNGTPNDIDAHYNYWGYTTAWEIEEHIIDDSDSDRNGKILFEPWLDEPPCNLVLSKHVNRPFASPGGELDYELAYMTIYGVDATGVSLEDNLPDELRVLEESISDGGIYDPIEHSISWNIGELKASSGMKTVNFKTEVISGIPENTEIVNSSSIWSAENTSPVTSTITTMVLLPRIITFSPNSGGNTGFVTITFRGQYLDSNVEVRLLSIGQEDIIATSITGSFDGTRLSATFDLTDAIPGARDLVVIIPGGEFITFSDAFNIQSGGEAKLWVEIIGPDRVRVGRPTTFMVRFGNFGILDVSYPWLSLEFPAGVPYDVDVPWATPPVTLEEPPAEDAIHVTLLDLPPLHAGSDYSQTFTVTPNTSGSISFRARIMTDATPYFTSMLELPSQIDFSNTAYSLESDLYKLYGATDSTQFSSNTDLRPRPGYVVIWDMRSIPEPSTGGDMGFHIAKSLGPEIVNGQPQGNSWVIEMWYPRPQFNLPYALRKRELGTLPQDNYIRTKNGLSPPNYTVEHGEEIKRRADEVIRLFQAQGRWEGELCKSDIDKDAGKLVTNCLGVFHILNPEFSQKMNLFFIEEIYDFLAYPDRWDKIYDPYQFSSMITKYAGYFTEESNTVTFINTGGTGGVPCSNLGPDEKREIIKRLVAEMSWDPNDKSGHTGFDHEGTLPDQLKRFISADQPMGYMVFFENLETATAAAQEVLITDQLDPNLDWSTLLLEAIQIGEKSIPIDNISQNFTTEIDLRPEIRAVVEIEFIFNPDAGWCEWIFRGKNPDTGELAGFLPPNKTGVAPAGQGWVSYSVKTKPNLHTGTVIKNMATIDFEIGIPPDPMDTPEFFNTIDSGIPTSEVIALPSHVSSTAFTVNWKGTDDEEGSGIRHYSIYVSEDGESFSIWLSQTSDLSAQFTGERGHTYYFYSRAEDNVGNVEEAPEAPDAFTKVTAPHWTLISIPYLLADNSLSKVLESIEGHYGSVWSYEASTKEWKRHFVDGPAFLNNLYTIEAGKGYYIEMFDSTPLNVVGNEVADDPIDLLDDWNLVGYNSLESKSCVEALASMSGFYISVWSYNHADGGWDRYVAGWPEEENDLETMDPWKGYWINANAPCSWDVNDMSAQAGPSVAGRVDRRQVARNRPQLPYTIWGSVEADGTEITRKRDCTVILKINDEVHSRYKLGTLEQYGDYYVIDVPEDTDNSAQIELYVKIDADTVKAANVPRAEAGRAIQFDLSVDMIPETSILRQNYPNPFNPDTWIPYQLSEDSHVEIRIFSVTGQLVRTLDLGRRSAGFYTSKEKAAYWDGRNETGESVASGVYFYSIKAGGLMTTRKMVVAK